MVMRISKRDFVLREATQVSAPTKKQYTLDEIETLAREYVTKVAEPNSLVDWRMSDFIQWLANRERDGNDG